MKRAPLRLLTYLLFAALPLQAQQRPAMSPELLLITREAVRPGKADAYAENRAAVARVLDGDRSSRICIALKSISGEDEVWRLEFAAALADLEVERERSVASPQGRAELLALMQGESDILSSRHRITALHQRKLSYQPEFDWATVRYVDLITVRVRPGKHPEYNELRRMSKAAHDKGGLDGPLLVYKATSGVQGLVWMIVRPLTSLKQHDELRAQGFGEPLTEVEDRRMTELRAASMEYAEERFFRVMPQLSNVPASWDAGAPPFWHER